jgi:membrane-associated phospholipid phosphatase
MVGLSLSTSVQASLLSDWNDAFLDSFRAESVAPPLVTRDLAIVYGAVYDAVSALVPGYQSYRISLDAPRDASLEAAVSGAAWQVGISLFPSRSQVFSLLLDQALAAIPDPAACASGLGFGITVANAFLNMRATDGASTTVTYLPRFGPGDWRRTAPAFRPPELPHWAYVTPFIIQRADQFRPPGPPPLTSPEYAAALQQVRLLGAAVSSVRTPYQTETAIFWSDFSYTATPPGHWNEIAQAVAASQHLSLSQEASMFALLNLTMADVAIATWDAKYYYNFWRPDTAIEFADLDGNPLTQADPAWVSLLAAPPHPEYVSGHSAFGGAAATVLASFFGTNAMPFSITSDTLPGVTRAYPGFWEAAVESGQSRVYAGIHFGFSTEDGLALGRDIGLAALQSGAITIPEPSVTALALLGLAAGLALRVSRRQWQSLASLHARRSWASGRSR